MNDDMPGFLQVNDEAAASQAFDVFYTKAQNRAPLERLCLALLDDALNDLRRGGRARRREAEEWIRTEGVEWTFSFDSVCEVLKLDPRAARKAIFSRRVKRRSYTKRDRYWGSQRVRMTAERVTSPIIDRQSAGRGDSSSKEIS